MQRPGVVPLIDSSGCFTVTPNQSNEILRVKSILVVPVLDKGSKSLSSRVHLPSLF